MILYFLGWIIQEWFCQFGLTLRNLFWSHQGSIHCNRTRWRRLVLETILGQRMDTLGSFSHWKQRWGNHSQTIHWVLQRERRIGDHHGFPRRQFALFVFYATRLVKKILISFFFLLLTFQRSLLYTKFLLSQSEKQKGILLPWLLSTIQNLFNCSKLGGSSSPFTPNVKRFCKLPCR